MRILKINQADPEPEVLKLTSQVLKREEVIIHPTETVYGFAAVFPSILTATKILNIKKRNFNHPMSIMVNNIDQVLEISGQTNSGWLKELLTVLFPAPLTLLIPRSRKFASAYWDQFPKFGFRFPDHLLSQKLLKVTGAPLITTSANIRGVPPVMSAQDLSRDLIQQVELILDGGPTREKIASTILDVDLNSKKIVQIREGAVTWTEIEKRIEGLKN